jgi:hypothetical protein
MREMSRYSEGTIRYKNLTPCEAYHRVSVFEKRSDVMLQGGWLSPFQSPNLGKGFIWLRLSDVESPKRVDREHECRRPLVAG